MFPLVPALVTLQAPALDSPSAFLPAIGETATYRYSQTLTTPNGTKAGAADLSLKRLSGNDVQVTVATDGRTTDSMDFFVDQTGALQPVMEPAALTWSAPTPGNSRANEMRFAAKSLLLRLSLASRLGAHPVEETSFPIQLDVAWANGPVDPILSIRSDQPDTFVADASTSTSINPPQKQPRLGILLPLGLGLAGIFSNGTTGRVINAAGMLASAAFVPTARGPLPVDIRLHLTGSLAAGRLLELDGEQDSVEHGAKENLTITDKWSIKEL